MGESVLHSMVPSPVCPAGPRSDTYDPGKPIIAIHAITLDPWESRMPENEDQQRPAASTVEKGLLMRLPTILVVLALTAAPAFANGPLGGSVEAVGISFNATAREHGLAVRVGEHGCKKKGKVAVCRFSADGGVSITAASTENHDIMRHAILAFDVRELESGRATEALQVASLIFVPRATKDEVTAAVAALTEAIVSERKGAIELGDIAFTPVSAAGMVMVFVEAR